MKYVSIDIETTGLDPDTCQVLEIAAVKDDLLNPRPFYELDSFHCYVYHELLQGTPFALALNAKALARVAKLEKPWVYLTPTAAVGELQEFLGFDKITAAGKNFAGFDFRFIQAMARNHKWTFHHRTLDPAPLYWQAGDLCLPDTELCIQRAGIDPVVPFHEAMSDALNVVQLLRVKLVPGYGQQLRGAA